MGELIALRWGDVDFDTEALHVYGSYSLGTLTAPKSGLTRTVPTAEQVRGLLKNHRDRVPHARGDLVFPGERGEFLDGSALRRRYKRHSRRPSSVLCASTTYATRSARSPSTRPRSCRSRRGWATPTSRPP
ncbi:MAG: hypothetical protein H0T43_04890 [Solirubrobacterales bacterium]|nr:hypothetical protein [Solirubrobacterales bacterium]